MISLVPLTKEGSEKLKAELKQLTSVERPAVIKAIAEARAHGDLKENAEYHAAREKQSFLEGRIQDLEGKLSNCQIIDVTQMENDGKVIFGSTVTLLNYDTGVSRTYKIVSPDEADIKENKVSVQAPIIRAVIGKYVHDVIDFDAPDGAQTVEIQRVEYI